MNNISETLKTIFDGVDVVAASKKVVGEPIVIGNTTIIPFIETVMGAGVGEYKDENNAGGMGCKVSPIACLVIQNGVTKLVTIKEQDVLNKALDMLSEFVDRLTLSPQQREEIKKGIEKITSKKTINKKVSKRKRK